MIPPDPGTPDPSNPPEPETGPARPAHPSRPGSGTFTIEGRQAPALFVIGWLAVLLGAGTIGVALLSGGGGAAPILLIAGLIALGVGLIAGAGSQGLERRARGTRAYVGPSPLLVFAASIPLAFLAVIALGIPMSLAGIPVQGPAGAFVSVIAQTLIYVGLIRLVVVDAGALSWRTMGMRRPDGVAVRELATGALWAGPVIVLTLLVAGILVTLFRVTPVSPLPSTGESTGFLVNLLVGVVLAPVGEEIMFRGFATTAWAADLGPRRALIRGAVFFALAHVLTITGGTAGEAISLAIIAFATRVPVALALGWLFLQRRSIWVSIGLHAAFNGILLTITEIAVRSGAG